MRVERTRGSDCWWIHLVDEPRWRTTGVENNRYEVYDVTTNGKTFKRDETMRCARVRGREQSYVRMTIYTVSPS